MYYNVNIIEHTVPRKEKWKWAKEDLKYSWARGSAYARDLLCLIWEEKLLPPKR